MKAFPAGLEEVCNLGVMVGQHWTKGVGGDAGLLRSGVRC